MGKLNIDGEEAQYDIIDCKDKLLLFKVPNILMMYRFDELSEMADKLKEDFGAKNVLLFSDLLDIELIENKEVSLKIIDNYIDGLNKIKEKFLKEDEDDKNESEC